MYTYICKYIYIHVHICVCLSGLNHAKDADEDNSSIRVAECLEGEAMALIESAQVIIYI